MKSWMAGFFEPRKWSTRDDEIVRSYIDSGEAPENARQVREDFTRMLPAGDPPLLMRYDITPQPRFDIAPEERHAGRSLVRGPDGIGRDFDEARPLREYRGGIRTDLAGGGTVAEREQAQVRRMQSGYAAQERRERMAAARPGEAMMAGGGRVINPSSVVQVDKGLKLQHALRTGGASRDEAALARRVMADSDPVSTGDIAEARRVMGRAAQGRSGGGAPGSGARFASQTLREWEQASGGQAESAISAIRAEAAANPAMSPDRYDPALHTASPAALAMARGPAELMRDRASETRTAQQRWDAEQQLRQDASTRAQQEAGTAAARREAELDAVRTMAGDLPQEHAARRYLDAGGGDPAAAMRMIGADEADPRPDVPIGGTMPVNGLDGYVAFRQNRNQFNLVRVEPDAALTADGLPEVRTDTNGLTWYRTNGGAYKQLSLPPLAIPEQTHMALTMLENAEAQIEQLEARRAQRGRLSEGQEKALAAAQRRQKTYSVSVDDFHRRARIHAATAGGADPAAAIETPLATPPAAAQRETAAPWQDPARQERREGLPPDVLDRAYAPGMPPPGEGMVLAYSPGDDRLYKVPEGEIERAEAQGWIYVRGN